VTVAGLARGLGSLRLGLGLVPGLLLAGQLTGCSTLAGLLPGATPATAQATTGAPQVPEFQLDVQAPAPLRALLLRHLDIARLQQLPEGERLGPGEFNRLVAAAPAQARELLQTEGYFDAQVQAQREAATPTAPRLVRLVVEPGAPTRVAALRWHADGAVQAALASEDADARRLRETLRAPGDGVLAAGAVFRNADWTGTKQQLLTRLRSAGYAAARLVDSTADIDADARTATLSVTLDSGPRFLAGPVLVSGLKLHDEATVRALAGFDPGTALTEERLTAFQDRLQKTRLFQSASVTVEPDPAMADAAPVRVRVQEAPLQQATAGVGISANTGPRATLEHSHRRVFGWPVVADNKLEWGRDAQSWSGDFSSHPGPGFWRQIAGVQVERAKSDADVVLTQRLRVGRAQDTPRMERLFFLELVRSRQADLPGTEGAIRSGGVASIANALSANAHWVWRDLDNVLLPTRGLSLALQTGVGQANQHGGPNGAFARLYGRLTGYLPLGDRWYGTARLELGHLAHGSGVKVPDALGFRAGGDDSVRGYAWRSLAPTDALGGTVSGERLLTASAEVARPILASMPSLWGALFIDAGRAVNDWRGFRPAWGYGAGLRWRSPIGPLRLDLARADELKQFRLHFSVGIAF
jgi:translocation and assembly module TamA